MRRTVLTIGAALLAGSVAIWARRQRRNPSACPYSQRLFLDLPRPFLRREALRALLNPVPGERMLEVGPGLGYYSLPVGIWLTPGGQLDALDLQPSMLAELMRRADRAGVDVIVPKVGDALDLPYPDATFDAAFLVATLGEIPEQDQALRELRRVLKPGGRLIIGEGQPDPHMVPLDDLRQRAAAAGFQYSRYLGGRFGYMARFENVGVGVSGCPGDGVSGKVEK